MKLNQTQGYSLQQYKQLNQNKQKNNTSFKGAGLQAAMNFLQTNQAVGATFVDAAFMCTPRTAFDTVKRGPAAGAETGFREFSSNINDAAMGAYGLGAATLLSAGVNKAYDVKAQKMFVDNDTLTLLAETRAKSGDINKTKNMKKYLDDIFSNTLVFSPNASNADKDGWVKLGKKTRKQVIEKLSKDIPNISDDKAKLKETRDFVKSLLVSDTGSEGDFKLLKSTLVDKKAKKYVTKEASSSVGDYVDKIINVSKAFMSEKVSKEFANGAENGFVKAIKGLNSKTAIGGIAMCAGIGASVQPLNVWLTKKRTGQTGFVGGGEEDKSAKFKAKKSIIAALAATGAILSIGKPKDLMKNLQFKGLVPTIPQFKFVYGITIVSRLLSSRNETELRESSIKDSLAFVNWLILGGFVSNLTAMALEGSKSIKDAGLKLIKYNANESMKNGKVVPKWIAGKVVSREEMMQQALKKIGKSSIENGKSMNFKQMFAALKSAADNPTAQKALKGLKVLSIVQAAGYLYSGLALGLGIPKLNLAITNSINKKNAQKAEAQK